jgi:hypothetical protein
MKIKTNENGRPISWGDDERIQSEDLPEPPGKPNEYVWTGKRWKHKPKNRDMSKMSDTEIASALRNGDLTVKEVLLKMMEKGKF